MTSQSITVEDNCSSNNIICVLKSTAYKKKVLESINLHLLKIYHQSSAQSHWFHSQDILFLKKKKTVTYCVFWVLGLNYASVWISVRRKERKERKKLYFYAIAYMAATPFF